MTHSFLLQVSQLTTVSFFSLEITGEKPLNSLACLAELLLIESNIHARDPEFLMHIWNPSPTSRKRADKMQQYASKQQN